MRAIKLSVSVLAMVVTLMGSLAQGLQQEPVDLEPVILVYCGIQAEVAKSFARILESDPRIDARVKVIPSGETFRTLLLFPQVAVGVIMCTASGEAKAVEDACISFFEQGGGMVGFCQIADLQAARGMASRIFPFFGNFTARRPPGRKQETYILQETIQGLNDGLSPSFVLPSESVTYSGDPAGTYLPVERAATVLYRDSEIGCPLVLACQGKGMGRSIGFSGCWVKAYAGAENHFSLLVENPDFRQLLCNAVLWCLEGSYRFGDLCSDAKAKAEAYSAEISQLRTSSEHANQRARTTRQLAIILSWVVGIGCSALIARRYVLAR